MRYLPLLLLAACSGATAPVRTPQPESPDAAVAETPPDDDADLGVLTFELTGGTAEARKDFVDGMLAMHSFWYTEATRLFEAAAAADPSFVMAQWGVAMSHAQILFQNVEVEPGRAALATITDTSSLGDRERAWVDAARALYASDIFFERQHAFAVAMEQMHVDYPDDDEVSLFLSLALLSDHKEEDISDTVRARAGSLALEVFRNNPLHPGAAHYIIHAFDTPTLAAIALPAARVYAKIAPAAYHARHMPAHIFARFGLWEEAYASCESAWDASTAWVKSAGLPAEEQDFHSLEWMMAMDFDMGRREDADSKLAIYADAVRAGISHGRRGGYLGFVTEYLNDTKDWSRLDQLLEPLSTPATIGPHEPTGEHAPPFDLFEEGQIIDLRTMIAVEAKDVAGVKAQMKEAARIRKALRPFQEQEMGKAEVERMEKQYAPMVKRMEKMLVARAKGDSKAVLPILLEQIAEIEKHPQGEPNVTGGSPREGLAQIYVELGKHAEALAEYRGLLEKHPRRARYLLGAAREAKATGDLAAAHAYYVELADVWKNADAAFPDLDEVRKAAAEPAPEPAASEAPKDPAPPSGHHH